MVLLLAATAQAAPLSSLGLHGQFIYVTVQQYLVTNEPDAYLENDHEFHGAAQADWRVTQQADSYGLLDEPWDSSTLHAKAILAADGQNVITRAGLLDTPFYNVLGVLVALDLASLMAGYRVNPILAVNGGSVPASPVVWTGALANGDEKSGFTADNWTDHLSGSAGIGVSILEDTQWLDLGKQVPDSFAKLYGMIYVPEPSSLVLGGFGALAVLLVARRRRRERRTRGMRHSRFRQS